MGAISNAGCCTAHDLEAHLLQVVSLDLQIFPSPETYSTLLVICESLLELLEEGHSLLGGELVDSY